LEKSAALDRVAASWYTASSYTLDVPGDGQPHQIALYCLDWDARGRSETVTISTCRPALLWIAAR
jgi:hypothetical protein